jgi:hypothetical protein
MLERFFAERAIIKAEALEFDAAELLAEARAFHELGDLDEQVRCLRKADKLIGSAATKRYRAIELLDSLRSR